MIEFNNIKTDLELKVLSLESEIRKLEKRNAYLEGQLSMIKIENVPCSYPPFIFDYTVTSL